MGRCKTPLSPATAYPLDADGGAHAQSGSLLLRRMGTARIAESVLGDLRILASAKVRYRHPHLSPREFLLRIHERIRVSRSCSDSCVSVFSCGPMQRCRRFGS